MGKAFFSIILPVYNSGIYLEEAVESILKQDFQDFELFLMDDGSTDGSSKKCDAYAKQDTRIRVIHQKNVGMGFARNRAISMAEGKYIGFCDHDDSFLPHCLKTCWEHLSSTYANVIKFGCQELYLENGKLLRTNEIIPDKDVYFDSQHIRNAFLYKFDTDYMGYIWDGFYEKELFVGDVKFNVAMRNGYEDEEIQMKMFPHLKSVEFISEVFYIHNIRTEFSNSKNHNDNQLNAMYLASRSGVNAVKQLKVEELEPAFLAVLIGRHLVTGVRCTVYADQKRNVVKMLKKIQANEAIGPYLEFSKTFAVIKRKKLWGLLYGLFSMKQYWLLKILVLYIRRQKCH